MKGNQGNYEIRRMTRRELNIAFDWAAAEGWNPGLYDADCFLATDPNGFFIGLLDKQPIACISSVTYDKHFGFLGFYIVKGEFRGKGYGMKIWHKAIEYLRTQNIGLDGVISQQENYKKSGFKIAHRNIRFRGVSRKTDTRDDNIIKLSAVSFEKIVEYDRHFFPASRPAFLKNWIHLPQSFSYAAIKKEKLFGFGVIRKCRQGYKIGPLFAEDDIQAEKLFLSLSNAVKPGLPIFLDVPEVNPSAIRLVARHKMKYLFETARMYTKKEPSLPLNEIFGITSFELG